MTSPSSTWVGGNLTRSDPQRSSSELPTVANPQSVRIAPDLSSQLRPNSDVHWTSPPSQNDIRGKRARAEGSRVAMSYPRKRAVTACELCRARKRKCNNARPKCRFCEDAGVDCTYGDPGDHSSFDPASLVMIDKLNQIIRSLTALQPQNGDVALPGLQSIYDPAFQSSPHVPTALGSSESPHSQTYSYIKTRHRDIEDFMEIPSSRTTADAILLWPIFDGKYPPEYLVDVLFETRSRDTDDECGIEQDMITLNRPKIPVSRPNFREDEVIELVEQFLSHVHIKNPILEVETLRNYARRLVEEGPGWDGGTCLVFLACALGALAAPFSNTPNVPLHSLRNGSIRDSTATFERQLQIAESNYALAARRIGLLQSSILRSQCYFWSGVYLMYTLRPVEAWEKFYHASSTYHIYLKGRLGKNEQPDIRISRTRRLEQRLYWSCFKSECEIRVELNLPESSIANVKYPDMFPSPPNTDGSTINSEDFASPMSAEAASSSINDQPPRSFNERQEKSWYYYLSEIALRRIGNNVLNTFYTSDQYPGSGMSIQVMVKSATNFLDQMTQWYEGLPPAIKYNQDDYSDLPREELAHITRGRALEIYTWLFRPFLYYAIHHAADDPYRAMAQGFADSAINIARATMKVGNFHYRHHGTWFHLRNGTSGALSMIAARKCGHIDLPSDWREVVQRHISVLEFWERESPDIAKAKDLLNTMIMELDER